MNDGETARSNAPLMHTQDAKARLFQDFFNDSPHKQKT